VAESSFADIENMIVLDESTLTPEAQLDITSTARHIMSLTR
jgi:hypothetical protein